MSFPCPLSLVTCPLYFHLPQPPYICTYDNFLQMADGLFQQAYRSG